MCNSNNNSNKCGFTHLYKVYMIHKHKKYLLPNEHKKYQIFAIGVAFSFHVILDYIGHCSVCYTTLI